MVDKHRGTFKIMEVLAGYSSKPQNGAFSRKRADETFHQSDRDLWVAGKGWAATYLWEVHQELRVHAARDLV